MRAAFPTATDDEVQAWAAAAVEGFLVRAAQDLVTRRLVAGGHPTEVEIDGAGHLEAARAGGRGAVVCSGHFLATRLARCWLAAHGMPMQPTRKGTLPARRVGRWGRRVLQPAYERFLRELIGDEILVTEGGSTLRILRHLREGRVVFAHLDTTFATRSRTYPLLGRPKVFGAGLLEMIYLTRAPLVPVAFAGDWRRLRIQFSEPLALAEAQDRESFVRDNMPRLAATLEGLISQRPDQWEYWVLGWPLDLHRDVFAP
jgi:KDO2-lipid IV(A) lauroyltransferase